MNTIFNVRSFTPFISICSLSQMEGRQTMFSCASTSAHPYHPQEIVHPVSEGLSHLTSNVKEVYYRYYLRSMTAIDCHRFFASEFSRTFARAISTTRYWALWHPMLEYKNAQLQKG